MVDINVASFFIVGLLILGLCVTAFRDLKLQSRFHNYWRWSLVFFFIGQFCFGIAAFVDKKVLIVANTMVVMSALALGLLVRTWHTTLTRRLEWWLWGLSLLVPVIYTLVDHYGSYHHRVFFVTSLFVALSVWRFVELTKAHRQEPSFTLKLLMGLSLIHAVLSLLRIIIVWATSDSANRFIYDDPIWVWLNRWGITAAYVLTYVAINEHYAHKVWQQEKQSLEAQLANQKLIDQLASEVNETHQLNQNLALVLAEKNKLLTSLSSSMKSARMGAMASTLAHEINQPLSAIRLNAEMVQRELGASDLALVKTNLNYLIEDVDRIDHIVNKIRKFFYNDYSDFKDLSLATLMDSTFDYVQEGCKKNGIDLMVNIDPSLHIYGDKGQLQMVVFNLINNAMDALADQGGQRFITVSAERLHDQINLIVQDNGPGIGPELKSQIFDLFRTTKPDGMGVGLWLSRAVMENHRGHLNFSNVPSGGARFVMQFPLPK